MTIKADSVEAKEEVKAEEKAVETKAQKKAAPKTAEVEGKEEEKADATETAYPLFQLRENAREVLGVKPEIFDGVFAKATEKELTKTEAKSHIEAFLKKEVK